jgi:hypothetical protein
MHAQRRSELLNTHAELFVQLLLMVIRLIRESWRQVKALYGASVERGLTVLEIVVAALSVDALQVIVAVV